MFLRLHSIFTVAFFLTEAALNDLLCCFYLFSSFPDLLSRIDLDELMKKDEPPFTFPKTLEEFEYAFNEGEHRLQRSEHGAHRVACFEKAKAK